MSTKAKESPIQYDMRAGQSIPLQLTRNGKTYRVVHHLAPLTNERYFEFQEQIEDLGRRTTKLSSAVFEPKEQLWNELAESVEGYKIDGDWKRGVHIQHKSEAMTSLLEVQVADDEESKADELWSIDENIVITFRTMQGGALFTQMSHSFRPETKQDTDEFLAIEQGEPGPNDLATANRVSRAERLYKLGQKLLKEHKGYADGSEIPAWHLAATTESFFARAIAQAKRL